MGLRFSPVVQSVEHKILILGVSGSSPLRVVRAGKRFHCVKSPPKYLIARAD